VVPVRAFFARAATLSWECAAAGRCLARLLPLCGAVARGLRLVAEGPDWAGGLGGWARAARDAVFFVGCEPVLERRKG